jgi:hypothetical protein
VTQVKPWVTQAICGVTQGKTRRDPRVGIAQAALFATKQRKNRGPPSKVYRGVTSTEESAVRTQLLHWQPCLEKRKGERIEAIWRSRTGNSLGDIHPTHLQPMRKREKAAFEACAERQRSRPLTLRPSHSLGLGSGWVLHGERAPAASGIIVRDTFSRSRVRAGGRKSEASYKFQGRRINLRLRIIGERWQRSRRLICAGRSVSY